MNANSSEKSQKNQSECRGKIHLTIHVDDGRLHVSVQEAKDLIPINAKGLANPYVTVKLIPDDTSLKVKTKTVKSTLNPLWNKSFSFDLNPGNNSKRVSLEVWNRSRRSHSGFMGSLSFGISEVTKEKAEGWFQLLKQKEGKLNAIPVPDDINGDMANSRKQSNDEGSYRWDGEMPEAAKTILHQHAIQGDVTDVQQAMCRWMAYSRRHLEHPMDYLMLLDLLEALDNIWETASVLREEEECLAESFNLFIEHSLALIRKKREVFPTSNKQALQRLENMLRCLVKIYEMEVFHQCCPFRKGLQQEVSRVVKKSTSEWYERMHNLCKTHSKVDHEEETIQGLIELTNALNLDMQHTLKFYTKLYEQIVNVQYFKIAFQQLEKMFGDELSDNLQKTLSRIEAAESCSNTEQTSATFTMGTALFELYLALQEFCKFKEHLPPNVKKESSINRYYEWFRFAVQKWLFIAKEKSYKRIHKAVDLDKSVGVNDGVKYSTSSVDVCCCFAQLTEFWKQLDWPDLLGAYPMVKKLTEDICGGAILYADLIHDKLKKAGYYDEEGQFDVTEQLCVTINSIEQVRRSLMSIPEHLKYNEIQTAMEAGNHGKRKLNFEPSEVLRKTDEEMITKIKQVVDRVADKMRPDIKKDVFHLNLAPEAVPADDAVGDLLEYLDSNLTMLNSNLLKTNFDSILESIWMEVLEEFHEVLSTEELKQPVFYQRMYDALGLLVEFLNANDKGLPMQMIITSQFKRLRKLLLLYKMDAEGLIEVFYTEKLEQQKNRREDIISQFEFAGPVFHSYAHNLGCQLKYGQRYVEGTGLVDGEGTERLWAYLLRFSSITKEMSE